MAPNSSGSVPGSAVPVAGSAGGPRDRHGRTWWKEAVVYQVYPRSFADSNGDGIGDIPGITSKLDYLKELGIDVIWLSPVYESPNDDNGYDISNYFEIMAEFGTMADFDELLAQAHARGIKIIMDLVANHTSDEHEWFIQSASSKDNPYRDYYIWRDPAGFAEDGSPLPPNNWGSEFGGPAWKFNEATGQFYLHIFTAKQPDLNWHNERVREDVYDMVRWWLDKGIDGFRLDAINIISKPAGFPDDPSMDFEHHGASTAFVINGEMVHPWMKELTAKVFDHYDVMTVGETSLVTPETAVEWAGYDSGELQQIFHFEHVAIDTDPALGKWSVTPFSLAKLQSVLNAWQTELHGKAWNALYWNNHDQPRVVSRFGDDRPEFRVASAKSLATALHFQSGTPYVYQGEEIGMTNVAFDRIEDYRDVDILGLYQDMVVDRGNYTHDEAMALIHAKGRDNARTPVQWDDSPNAGFTTGTPWIAVNPNYPEINVAADLASEDSIFRHYQRLIALRHGAIPGLEFTRDLMVYGAFHALAPEDEEVYSYVRTGEGIPLPDDAPIPDDAPLPGGAHAESLATYQAARERKILVMANFTDRPVTRPLPAMTDVTPLIGYELSGEEIQAAEVTLPPYGQLAAAFI